MSRSTSQRSKVLVLGLDGGTMNVLNDLLKSGRVPNIARIKEHGICGTLHSTLQPVTAQAWSTLLTGKNAGKHGVFDFRARQSDSYTFRLLNAGDRSSRSVFKVLSDSGLKVGSLSVPFTYPPETVNGFIIPGFDSPRIEGDASFPSGVFEEMSANVKQFSFKGILENLNIEKDLTSEDLRTSIRSRGKAIRYLWNRHQLDFQLAVFSETDQVQHLFWSQYEKSKAGVADQNELRLGSLITEAYILIDEEIGKTVQLLSENDYLILVSDHGATGVKKHVYLNRFLEKIGMLRHHEDLALTSIARRLLRRAKYLMKSKMSLTIRDKVRGRFRWAFDRMESAAELGSIDWQNTHAYSHGLFGNISLNLRGREPNGLVEVGDYENTCDRIINELYLLRDPDTGEQIVDHVFKRNELFSGDKASDSPDLIVKWKDYGYLAKTSADIDCKDIINSSKDDWGATGFKHSGTHNLEGIFLMQGPGVRKNTQISLSLEDVMPTVLHVMDVKVPRDLDGKVSQEIFEAEFRLAHGVTYDNHHIKTHGQEKKVYSETEENDINDRLRSLGYTE